MEINPCPVVDVTTIPDPDDSDTFRTALWAPTNCQGRHISAGPFEAEVEAEEAEEAGRRRRRRRRRRRGRRARPGMTISGTTSGLPYLLVLR